MPDKISEENNAKFFISVPENKIMSLIVNFSSLSGFLKSSIERKNSENLSGSLKDLFDNSCTDLDLMVSNLTGIGEIVNSKKEAIKFRESFKKEIVTLMTSGKIKDAVDFSNSLDRILRKYIIVGVDLEELKRIEDEDNLPF